MAIRSGFALVVPRFHCHPWIAAFLRVITVFDAERLRLHLCKEKRTLSQINKSSSGVWSPKYRSSAILATAPSWTRWPNTRHVSSSSAVSEPGYPMALLTLSFTLLNGVAAPQYFIESREKGI